MGWELQGQGSGRGPGQGQHTEQKDSLNPEWPFLVRISGVKPAQKSPARILASQSISPWPARRPSALHDVFGRNRQHHKAELRRHTQRCRPRCTRPFAVLRGDVSPPLSRLFPRKSEGNEGERCQTLGGRCRRGPPASRVQDPELETDLGGSRNPSSADTMVRVQQDLRGFCKTPRF